MSLWLFQKAAAGPTGPGVQFFKHTNSTGSSKSLTIECGGTDRLVIYMIHGSHSSLPSSVALNGIPMTFINRIGTSTNYGSLFYLLNPPVGFNTCAASGNFSVRMSMATAYEGVEQVVPPYYNFGTDTQGGSATYTTVVVNSQSNEIIHDFVHGTGSDIDPADGQVLLGKEEGSFDDTGAGYGQGTGGAKTHRWTRSNNEDDFQQSFAIKAV